MRALRMAERGMETCSEMDERGGLSLSAAEQDIGHNSRHRDTMESTTTWTQTTQDTRRHTRIHTHLCFQSINYLCTAFFSSARLDLHPLLWLVVIFYLCAWLKSSHRVTYHTIWSHPLPETKQFTQLDMKISQMILLQFYWSWPLQIRKVALCITTKLEGTNRNVKYAQVSWNSIRSISDSSSGCAAFLSFHCTVLPNPKRNRMELKKMLNSSFSVNSNATFLLKSAYLCRTHSYTRLIGNLNATGPEHYCLKYGCIREWPLLQLWPQFHLRPTCSSLSAALASSPASVSRRCLTGPSTDNTWANSHREGYS